MMRSRFNLILLFVLPALALAAAVPTAVVRAQDEDGEKPPLQIVKENSEAVLATLRDPELEGDENKEERHQKVRETVADNFDWRTMAQKGLGRHWRDLDEEQRDEFTGLFRKLLEQIYIKRIEEHAAGAEVSYVDEDIDGDRAVVNTMARKGGTKTPINYSMKKAECKEEDAEDSADDSEKEQCPAWLIYDVEVEGVSLLLNYREQFNEIIIGRGYDTLVKKLRKKVGED